VKPKNYDPQNGVMMDANFVSHQTICDQCKRFDAEKPATIALMCLEGSVLWKRENGITIKREAPAKPDTVVSKDEVKRVMRYKGDS
jgi:hypothetical protein